MDQIDSNYKVSELIDVEKAEGKLSYAEPEEQFFIIYKGEITKVTITKVIPMKLGHNVYKDDLGNTYFDRSFGKYIFKTYEEIKALEDRKLKIKRKKKMLKEYKTSLNYKLELENHFSYKIIRERRTYYEQFY